MLNSFNIYKYPFLLLVVLLVIFSSCYPEGIESNEDYDLIKSTYDPEMDFSKVQSFQISDSLVLLNDSTANEILDLTSEDKEAIVNKVRDNLSGYGWADSSANKNGETMVLVSAVVAKFSDKIWDQWSWYENFENISPREPESRYPWYPNYFPYVYDFVRGSVIITMSYRDTTSGKAESVPVIWIGSIDGRISSKELNISKINVGIDKLFELSEILHKN